MARTIDKSELTESNRLVPDGLINLYRVDEKTVVKLCEPFRLAEAEALRYVRSRTSIPVPEVFNAYVDASLDRGVIIMEYVEGDILRNVWEDMDDERRQKIVQQLKDFMTELRAIRGDFIGSIDGTACEDPVFCAELGGFGPYKTQDEFNDGLIRAMKLSQESSWVDQIAKFIKAMPQHEVVLTHSDFSPRNIIVRGDEVVAIIDWEMAGFYPEYWEYVKALYHPEWQSRWITDGTVEAILHPYYLEHAVLCHMQEIVW
jgi:tRNA A-37 threonylcarbamoyl transferase component Bud32